MAAPALALLALVASLVTELGAADLDGDGTAEPVAFFGSRDGRLGFARIGEQFTTEVRAAWKLEIADLDGDGTAELIWGMWSDKPRHAEPEPHRTVWVERYDGQRIVPVWRGSALARPLVDFRVADVDGDGRAELVALERAERGCRQTTYRLGSFGFVGQGSAPAPCPLGSPAVEDAR